MTFSDVRRCIIMRINAHDGNKRYNGRCLTFPLARTFKYQVPAIPTPAGRKAHTSEERKRMNVFGKNERSWRKARKRGVSPIIATILLVAITVVLAAVLYVLISGLTTGGVGSKPIGSAFSAGNPVSGICAATYTYAANGCKAADYIYSLTVETTGATFASVLFEVKTSTGGFAIAAGSGGFTVLNTASAIAAQATAVAGGGALVMTSTFPTYGASPICNGGVACGPSSPWASVYSIVIDMGTGNPTGQGFTFVAVGTGGYSGTTTPLLLP